MTTNRAKNIFEGNADEIFGKYDETQSGSNVRTSACKDHPNTSSAYLSNVTFREFRKAKLIASVAHSKLSTLRVDGWREAH